MSDIKDNVANELEVLGNLLYLIERYADEPLQERIYAALARMSLKKLAALLE